MSKRKLTFLVTILEDVADEKSKLAAGHFKSKGLIDLATAFRTIDHHLQAGNGESMEWWQVPPTALCKDKNPPVVEKIVKDTDDKQDLSKPEESGAADKAPSSG
ncbi:hypothetical protein ACFL5F_02550 [Planctomycetota bacterium]